MLKTLYFVLTILCIVPVECFGAYHYEAADAKSEMEAARGSYHSVRFEMLASRDYAEDALDNQYTPAVSNIWNLYPQYCEDIEHTWLDDYDNAQAHVSVAQINQSNSYDEWSAADIHADTGDSWFEQGTELAYTYGQEYDYEEFDLAIYHYNQAKTFYETAELCASLAESDYYWALIDFETATQTIIDWIDFYDNQ